MKRGFYPRLAADGIRKNRQLYLPYLLTQAGMVMMLYILLFLPRSPALTVMKGSRAVTSILFFGSWIMALFACIFLFYTNSFLIRRRKKEFGLYHILGMGKRNIGMILFWETLIGYVLSLAAGLFLGILFSKLAELGLIHLIGGEQTFTMSLSGPAIAMTAIAFGCISFLLLLNGLRQVHFSSSVSLLHSERQGEKPPRGNWLLGVLGLLLLAGAYALSISIQQPLKAMVWFFVAVVMVILATYLLMISGSVLVCRILQRKRNYYYRADHFVSLSSMIFRMKRNGAGLASICILCTMALVTISTTTCLYSGVQDGLNERFPREVSVTLWQYEGALPTFDRALYSEVQATVQGELGRYGAKPQNAFSYASLDRYMTQKGAVLSPDSGTDEDFRLLFIVSLEDYNAASGRQALPGSYDDDAMQPLTLAEDEVLLALYRMDYSWDTLTVEGLQTFQVKEQVADFPFIGEIAGYVYPTVVVIVPDLDAMLPQIMDVFLENGGISLRWDYCFDTGLSGEEQLSLCLELQKALSRQLTDLPAGMMLETREGSRQDFYADYGALLFLGILLSAVFLFAAVLIIYYKQISEGYEDQSRFAIMQKVGMTRPEIRKGVNSQLLTVFFLPLLGAELHLAFAFPMVDKLLQLFNLTNSSLFALTALVSFLVFALLYVLVYRLTSNTYYRLVSGLQRE